MNQDIYDIGVDIGTKSMGWAVVKSNGELAKFRGKHLWGTVLIQEEGKTAETRRLFRSGRRRIARKKQRIQWIQELLGPLVLEEDPHFFERMKYSYVSTADDSFNIDFQSMLGSIIENVHDYHLMYPTIYHLRKALIESDEKFDIRLIYLVIHHIVKYRGNFLYPGQQIEVQNLNASEAIRDMLIALGVFDDGDSELIDGLEAVLKSNKTKGEKKDDFVELLLENAPVNTDKPKDWAKALASLILGYKGNVANLWDSEDKTIISFSDDNYLKIEEELDDNQVFILDSIQKVYSVGVLQSILSGDVDTLSDAYIKKYEAHKNDISVLKSLLKKYCPENYNDLINNGGTSYAAYIRSSRKCNRDVLCVKLKKALEDMPQEDNEVQLCLTRIENQEFLLKPRNSENGAIPNQLHVEELSRIIDNQSKFYPGLTKIKQKLISIASFRIPYYVGPLSGKASPYAWAIRKEEGKIYPWNIHQKIDQDKTAEEFIKRLSNKCTYLLSEDVLPKNSILLSKFNVLNELANIKLNGKRLSPDCKSKAIEELFKTQKTVSKATFVSWLKNNKYVPNGFVDISGFADEKKFTANLSAYIDFKKIFGTLDYGFELLAEMIIQWITIFEDKEIRERKIKETLSDFKGITDEQKQAVLKLSYSGWGRLSRKLLTGIYSREIDNRPVSILDLMESTTMNFMEILYSEKYHFLEIIDEENLNSERSKKCSRKELVMSFPGSPALKKTTWVAIRVIDEIAKIMGGPARSIYVEVAAGDESKKRTVSRYNQLEKKYQKIKNDTSFEKSLKMLRDNCKGNPSSLSNKALMLYFLQNGKSLYSGATLEINELSKYQIDHILPQCYIKDDSFDNLALVLQTENQRKSDSLLLDESIINSQKATWESLLRAGLMSRKKFDNLIRASVSDQDANGFINRQLVETRQICKNVISAIEAIYGKNIVYGISAKLSSNIRKQVGLNKVREVNDFHHAQDALIAAKAGFFVQKRFSANPISHNWYREILQRDGVERKERYGILASLFTKGYLKGWNGYQEVERLHNWFGFHDYFVNCLTEENTSEFYNQILESKDGKTQKLIPRKKGQDPKLYGGYSGEKDAYFCIIEYLKGKGTSLQLIGIPVRIAARESVNATAVMDYLESEYKQVHIVKDRIKKYQHIIYFDGEKENDYYLVGANEVINARQLILSHKSYALIGKILNGDSQRLISDIEIENLYSELCEKMKLYPCFLAIATSCEKLENQFMELSFTQKKEFLKKMLVVMQANSSRVEKTDWSKVTDNEKPKFDIPGSRLNKSLKPQNIQFINSSITGVFKNKEDKWGLGQ